MSSEVYCYMQEAMKTVVWLWYCQPENDNLCIWDWKCGSQWKLVLLNQTSAMIWVLHGIRMKTQLWITLSSYFNCDGYYNKPFEAWVWYEDMDYYGHRNIA